MDYAIGDGVLYLLILHLSDLILTFYQFQILSSRGLNPSKFELNPVIRFIVRENPNPFKFLISEAFILTMIVGVLHISNFEPYVIGLFSGALMSINIFHFANIKYLCGTVSGRQKNNLEN